MATGTSQRSRQATPQPLTAEQARQIEDFKKNGPRNPEQSTLRSLATAEGLRRVRKIFELELNEFQIKLNAQLLKSLETDFVAWVGNSKTNAENNVRSAKQLSNQRWLLDEINMQQNRKGSQAPRFACDFLFHQIQHLLQELAKLKTLNQQFRRNFATANTQKVRHEIILHFAQCLNSDKRSLTKDEVALKRWFDEEALNDRFLKLQGEKELMLCFTLDRLATTVVHIFHRAMEFNSIRFGGAKADLQNRINGIWQRLNVETSLLQALVYQGDVRIHVAAIRAMRTMLKPLPSEISWHILSQRMVGFIDRAARQKNSDVWIQCEALTILSNLSIDAAVNVIDQRLRQPGQGDDMFVRQHAWSLIEELLNRGDGHQIELDWPDDPSSFVRQKMAVALFLSYDRSANRRWRRIIMSDADPKVRAAAVATAVRPGLHTQQAINFFRILPHVLKREQDEFVLRTAMWSITEVLKRSLARLEAQTQGDPSQLRFTILTLIHQQIQPALCRLQSTHDSISVRRWASQCNERIWGLLDPQISPLIQRVASDVGRIKPGRCKTYPMKWFDWVDDVTLTRMFAVLSQDDFGYDIEKTWRGLRVTRGPTFGFRLWRFWHELRRSATDKRQGHRHLIGRISTARLKAPSQILGELSQTKVPGEPLTIASDSTWRPFLPLVDDIVSVLNMSWLKPKTVKIVSNQGVTSITPPLNLSSRIAACFRITKNFAKYAALRNGTDETKPTNAYIHSLTQLGFSIDFAPHQYADDTRESSNHPAPPISDASIHSLFESTLRQSTNQSQAILPIATHLLGASYNDLWLTHFKRFTSYFTSLYENSLGELVVFACFVLLLVILKHVWMNLTFRRSRNKIPLSIGGWGTRGKSGTERLKAALMGVMGHGLVSKTTGCEAMFIHAYPFGQPLEIPLFRPSDKATIWEQRNLINIAAKMKPSVFLWECMALNPAYVNVLQHQWMKDDIATITNTYPDHEDIQGPAGYDVAQTIAGFVPNKSLLVTTEEQMKPYVTHQCRRNDTDLQSVGWLQSGLLTDDLLSRFPYQEHPDNIALVSQMASNLGISHEQSVKAMADDLVPDLGVLKTHPVATVKTRRIEFTNGMSANERFGCMGNWKRLRYDAQDPWTDPTTWVVAVINNRADRVPRSKVFAEIVVNDIHVDRYFLIGTNLNGLKTFIDQAWQQRSQRMTLKQTDGSWDYQSALATLEKSAWNLRQPVHPTQIDLQIRHMVTQVNQSMVDQEQTATLIDTEHISANTDLKKVLSQSNFAPDQIEAITRQQQRLNGAYREYQRLYQLIQDNQPIATTEGQSDSTQSIDVDQLDEKYRALMRLWFSRKFVIVADSEASGEHIIGRIVHEVPPGYLARTMGMQNIKGTGLDFVYRFHAWDTCFEACEATQDRRLAIAEKAIAALVAMPEIGQLCHHKLMQTIQQCRTNKLLQRTDLQLQLDILESRIESTNKTDHAVAAAGDTEGGHHHLDLKQTARRLHQWSLQWAEEFLDVNDSIRRREKAELIYRDYVACRISRQRAVVELRALNKRQKGGWLKEDSRKLRDRFRSRSA